MEQHSPHTLKERPDGVETLVSMLKYVLSFFMIMLITYVSCTASNGSVWFSLISAISAGILALIVCNAMFNGGKPGIRHYYIWMSALLSFCGIAVCYTALGVYPFGEESVMIIDMHHQYSAFFSLMREKALSFGSLTYSDSVGMGSGFLPLIAYYLCSPFNIIAVIFPRDNLTEAIALIEMLKITSAGIYNALYVIVRIALLMMISAALTFTTSPSDLTDAIERLMKPLTLLHIHVHEIAMMMTIALRFIPVLLEEIGLRVPQITKIMMLLRQHGMNVDPTALTVEHGFNEVVNCLS